MNAMMREPYEVPVVANETIEANLTSLRTGLDEVKADVRELKADYRSLRDKVDQNYDTLNRGQITLRDKLDDTRSELSGRIEQVRSELGSKIEQVRTGLEDKIDRVCSGLEGKIEQVRTGLEGKIDQFRTELSTDQRKLHERLGETNVSIAEVATMQKVILWIIGSVVPLAALVEVVIRVGTHFKWF